MVRCFGSLPEARGVCERRWKKEEGRRIGQRSERSRRCRVYLGPSPGLATLRLLESFSGRSPFARSPPRGQALGGGPAVRGDPAGALLL